MRRILFLSLILLPFSVFSQGNRNAGGQFALGVRSTVSLFSDHSSTGTGFGGQFRLRYFEFLNSEFFADYLTSDVQKLGSRTDYHIGWSVMFYFTKENRNSFKPYVPRPYFLTGHCFDYTSVQGNNPFYQSNSNASRWSSAVQAGLGMHIPLTPRFDFSTNVQYMYHMGKELEVEERVAANGDHFLYTAVQEDTNLEGHLLITFSVNLRVADLWKDAHRGGAGKAPLEEQQQ